MYSLEELRTLARDPMATSARTNISAATELAQSVRLQQRKTCIGIKRDYLEMEQGQARLKTKLPALQSLFADG